MLWNSENSGNLANIFSNILSDHFSDDKLINQNKNYLTENLHCTAGYCEYVKPSLVPTHSSIPCFQQK